jgi:hypothetical protein
MIRDSKFRKSGASDVSGCVEVAALPSGGIRVRDSKNPDNGTLSCTDQEWRQFVQGIKAGHFSPRHS